MSLCGQSQIIAMACGVLYFTESEQCPPQDQDFDTHSIFPRKARLEI
jgi:hypothetical protein